VWKGARVLQKWRGMTGMGGWGVVGIVRMLMWGREYVGRLLMMTMEGFRVWGGGLRLWGMRLHG